jgi:hypothetical protein
MGILNIASLGLLFGAVGQSVLWGPSGHHGWIYVSLLPPWLTIYIVSFCRQAPCGPEAFRRFLMFAISWYSITTFLLEMRYFLRAERLGNLDVVVAQALIGIGLLSLVVPACVWLKLRRVMQSKL